MYFQVTLAIRGDSDQTPRILNQCTCLQEPVAGFVVVRVGCMLKCLERLLAPRWQDENVERCAWQRALTMLSKSIIT